VPSCSIRSRIRTASLKESKITIAANSFLREGGTPGFPPVATSSESYVSSVPSEKPTFLAPMSTPAA
jgi:hypothetical protein